MIHERLDIARWKSAYPLHRLRQEGSVLEVDMISTPDDIALLEQLRDATYGNLPGVDRVPTDIFVWQPGEPEHREVTKIGGLPYRESGKPWPTAPAGVPMNFVAQICFADSRDIVPPLRGDILLMFAAGEWTFNGKTYYDLRWYDGLAFEWGALGDFALMTPNELPKTPWPVMPCYGAIHRTWDYLNVDGSAYRELALDIPSITEATKIGGIGPWIHERDYCWFGRDGDVPGTYFCTLSSVSPKVFGPLPAPEDYGLAGLEEPRSGATRLEERETSCSRALMIADVGLLNFFLDSSGNVRWTGHFQT